MNQLSQTEVDETLRSVDDFIDRIGDKMTGTRREQDDGTVYTVRDAQRGDCAYHIVASPDMPFCELRSTFNMVEALAIDMAASEGRNQATNQDLDDARRRIRRQAEDVDLAEVESEFRSRISDNGIAVETETVDGVLTSFSPITRLFVYDEGLTISEFDTTVQTIVNAVVTGQTYLVDKYELRDSVDDRDPSRGFA